MDFTLFIAIIAAGVLVSSTITLVILVAYLRNRQELAQLKKYEEEQTAKAEEKAASIRQEAEEEALQIVRNANEQAGKVLRETELFAEESKEHAEELLDKTYKEILDRVVSENINLFKNVSTKLGSETEKAVENFRTVVQGETLAAKTKIEQEVEAQTSQYKEQKIKEAEASVNEMLANITKEVLGQSLTGQQHQELIKKAFEQAKSSIK